MAVVSWLRTTSTPLYQERGRRRGWEVQCVRHGTSSEVGGGKPGRRVALFVEPSPFTYVCGYRNRFTNTIRQLGEAGDEVTIFTTCTARRGGPKEPSTFHSAEVAAIRSFPCPGYKGMPLASPLNLPEMRQLFNFSPELIHASSPGLMAMSAAIFSKLLDVPLVLSYHTHLPKYVPDYSPSPILLPLLVPLTWSFIRILHSAADVTLVTSVPLQRELEEKGVGNGRIQVWQRGVDTDVFSPSWKSSAMRSQLLGGVGEDTLKDSMVLLYVGRLGAEKNIKLLRGVLDALPDVHLSLVGEGPERENLEEYFKDYENVTFMGLMEGEPLSAAYASADVFVMPSESETLGFVVLEAMASGVPVVAARAGGIPDIIDKDGETGFLFKPGDVRDFSEKVRNFLDDDSLREKVGRAGRAEVERWGWGAATEKLRDEQYASAMKIKKEFGKGIARLFQMIFLLPVLPLLLILRGLASILGRSQSLKSA